MDQPASQSIFPIKGYLYIVLESFTISTATKEVVCHLSLGENANCQTNPHKSGKFNNAVFLIEVGEDSSRLSLDFRQEGTSLGECNYDIIPFFANPTLTHTMSNDIIRSDQETIGNVSFKITYYSTEYGKLKLRVFSIQMIPGVVEYYKQAKLKAKIGIHAQSSELWDMTRPFDQILQLLVLNKNNNLQFQVVHTEGVLAKYTIYDLQKSNLLINQVKAYQVSLFNKDTAVANIKYQVEWIH